MRTKYLFALLVLLFGVLTPVAGLHRTGIAHAAAPAITLYPNAIVGPSGSVAVAGSGFTPNAHVTMHLDNSIAAGNIPVDGGGNFSATINVTNAATGPHTMLAVDTANVSASQTLYAVALNLSTTSAAPGAQVTIGGQGFLPSQPLVVYLGSQAVLITSTDASGAFPTQPFTVPASLSGAQQLRVQSGSSGQVAVTTNFTIGTVGQAALTVSPNSVAANGTFSVSGSGFAANAVIILRLDSTTLTSAFTASGLGTFGPVQVSVPAGTASGQHTITASDSGGHTLASTQLTITAQSATLSLTPNGGVAGSQLSASGSGFAANETILLEIGGKVVTAATANAQGQFSVTFSLPKTLGSGATTVQAIGQASHTAASASFSIPAATLTLSTTGAPAGASVTVSGHNFASGEIVTISVAGNQAATATADGNGSFTATITIPAGQAGAISISATGTLSHDVASASFNRAAASLQASATSVQVGHTLTLTGSGFAANEQVAITIPGSTLQTLAASAQGGFSTTVTIPAGQAAGNVTISAAGQSSHQTATTTVAVTAGAVLSLSATTVAQGASVTVTGTGFAAGEPVVLTMPGFSLATTVASAQGGFSVSVTIPSNAPVATATITALGAQSHRTGQASLVVQAVQAHLVLSVTTILAGSTMQVSGSGFQPNEAITITASGATVLTLNANSSGAFSNVPVTIPVSLPSGALALSATGASSHRVATTTLIIQPRAAASLTVSPPTFSAGSPVKITGTGFAPRETVILAVNGAQFATALSGSGGDFILTVTLPVTGAMNSAQITATGSASHVSVHAAVSIAAIPVLTIGKTTWYYAAGRTDSGFSEEISLLNPNITTAHGTITFFYNTNTVKTYSFTLKPQARGTYDVGRIIGAKTRVAAMVQSDLPVAAARTTMRGELDRMSTTGVSAPARTWYMAEGYTSLTFQEDLNLLNPGDSPARVHIVWPLFNGRPPVSYDLTMAPRTHVVIPVNSHVDRASHATVITSDVGIVASRTMLFGANQQGGHSKAGMTHGDTTLYFAEGSTNNGFEEYLTILNPDNNRQAQVTASFYDRQGRLLGIRSIQIDSMHRGNIKVNDVVRATAVSTVLHSNIPIVAERSMYFGAPNSAAGGGTVVFGHASPAKGWAFATGDTRPGHSEFELLFNPNQTSSTIEATYYADTGQAVRKTFTLPGNARLNIDVTLMVPQLPRGYHGVILRSLNGVSFIAEQAIYGNHLSNGSATVGTPAG